MLSIFHALDVISIPRNGLTNLYAKPGITVLFPAMEASIAGKSTVIPGLAYKLVKPFLGMEITSKAWKMLNKRN